MSHKRKIFYVVATGGHDTDRHYYETIKTKKTLNELKSFFTLDQIGFLKTYLHEQPFAIWGTVPGERNTPTWENMSIGDYVMVYRSGKVIAAAEVALKLQNASLARHLWQEDSQGKTWELIYILTNVVEVDVSQEKLNQYLGYSPTYNPRGFMSLSQDKTDKLLITYGDLISLLQKIGRGEDLETVETAEFRKQFTEIVEDNIVKAPTEHVEMQWRLIQLGLNSRLDVWVPNGDQGKTYEGNTFKQFVLKEFNEAQDTPSYVKNIDTVWKLGYSIKAAFEIENSTSIYSGILRLSDLRALAPNSNYPLFIVADKKKEQRVFEQLKRPTFSNSYLELDKVVRFLSYDSIRELDADSKQTYNFDISEITKKSIGLETLAS